MWIGSFPRNVVQLDQDSTKDRLFYIHLNGGITVLPTFRHRHCLDGENGLGRESTMNVFCVHYPYSNSHKILIFNKKVNLNFLPSIIVRVVSKLLTRISRNSKNCTYVPCPPSPSYIEHQCNHAKNRRKSKNPFVTNLCLLDCRARATCTRQRTR